MRDKGYPFPLYSLDLIRHEATPLDDLRFSLPAPDGRLQVRRALRRIGERVTTTDCQDAVLQGLARQRLLGAALERYGLGPEWAGGVRHWLERLIAPTEERWRLEVEEREAAGLCTAGQEELRALWRRLALAAGVAQLGGLLPGAEPRSHEARQRAIGEAARRIEEDAALAALLAEHGFGPPQRLRLAAVLDELARAAERGARAAAARRACSDELAVVRGALLGDLARLRAAAEDLGAAAGRGANRLA